MGALRFIVGVLGAFVLLVFSILSFLLLAAMSAVFGPWCWLFALMPALILASAIGSYFAHK